MTVADRLHDRLVLKRRAEVLARLVAERLPPGARALDVGCGDGLIAARVMELRPDVTIEGVDVLVRPGARIPVRAFDGATLPFADASWDAAMLVDVLHHTDDPAAALAEVARVAPGAVVLKDHTLNGPLAGPTLRLMDYVGNARHGVRLPYNYWPRARWHQAFADLGLRVESWTAELGLYPPPLSWLFGRSLHFVARLSRG
jgi:SAM-dependent methyltransferase